MSTLKTTTYANLATLQETAAAGDTYYETDNNRIVTWNGTNWSYYGNDGTVSTTLSANDFAVSYDGTDDYHELGLDGTSSGGVLASSDTDVELTISAWIYPLVTAKSYLSWATVYNSSTPFFLIQHNNILVDGGYRYFSTSLTTNAWHHVLITRTASNNTWSVFLNGNSTAVVTYSDGGSISYRSNATDFYVGSGYPSPTNCRIDELAFWNSDQSSNLSSIYGSSTAGSGSPTNLESLSPYGWWRMGDGVSGVSNGGAAGTISSTLGSANDLTVGGGSPTYTNSVQP